MAEIHTIEGVLLDESHEYTLVELSRICVINEDMLREMADFGIIEPRHSRGEWVFSGTSMIRIRKALRLRRDLSINWEGISLALDLLDQIDELRQQLGK